MAKSLYYSQDYNVIEKMYKVKIYYGHLLVDEIKTPALKIFLDLVKDLKVADIEEVLEDV